MEQRYKNFITIQNYFVDGILFLIYSLYYYRVRTIASLHLKESSYLVSHAARIKLLAPRCPYKGVSS